MGGPYKTPTGLGSKDREGDPQTGRAAASVAAKNAETVRELVFEEIERAGWRGATPDEIAKRLGEDIGTVRPRCTDLKTAERIACNGERRPNDKGNMMAVLVAIRFLPEELRENGPAAAESSQGQPEQGSLL